MMDSNSFLSLSLLNGLIKDTLLGNFMEDMWVVAEIADMRSAVSGHCYMELVEKKNDKIVARIKANVWSYSFSKIQGKFLSETGTNLQKGMNVLFIVTVNFHEQFGLSLVVKDVNTEFTLGAIAKSKKEALARLKKEGLLRLNSELELELVPKRIAIISSPSAAGYEDFMNQIKNNSKNYLFELTLFDALMQGEQSVASIIGALNTVRERKLEFDSVTIIRGGGASLDLNHFDSYELAAAVANFPLPVISGVGHERDLTILDEVAHTRVKTPTAAASFYIQQLDDFSDHVIGLSEDLSSVVNKKLSTEREKNTKYRAGFSVLCQQFLNVKKRGASELSNKVRNVGSKMIEKNKLLLQSKKSQIGSSGNLLIQNAFNRRKVLEMTLTNVCKSFLESKKRDVLFKKKSVSLVDPINVLNRGFAMVKNKDGRYLKSKSAVDNGEALELVFKDGSVDVTVNKK